MRWSMVPVSVAAHSVLLVALIFNPIDGSDLPAPWPSSSITFAAAMSPPPMPALPRPTAVNRVSPDAPTQAPEGIKEALPTPTTGPESDYAITGIPVDAGVSVPFGFGATHTVVPPAPILQVQNRPSIVRVGGVIREPKKVVHFNAVYPEIARNARIEGLVIVEATIDERGVVIDARVLRSVPLLDPAALAALRQWRYTPTLLNGVPVRVLTTITFNFRLGDRVP